jgi:hypothetical protein
MFSYDVEQGGLDPFEEQDQMLAELGQSASETENEDGSVTVDFGDNGESKKEEQQCAPAFCAHEALCVAAEALACMQVARVVRLLCALADHRVVDL